MAKVKFCTPDGGEEIIECNSLQFECMRIIFPDEVRDMIKQVYGEHQKDNL